MCSRRAQAAAREGERVKIRLTTEDQARSFVRMLTVAPDPEEAPAYVDVSVVPAVLRVWDGSGWVAA